MEHTLSGLQIPWRCVGCKSSPTLNQTLYEMQNHLYICTQCLLQEQRSGRQVWGVDGQKIAVDLLSSGLPITNSSPEDREISEQDFFQILEISPASSALEVQQAIEEKIPYWMEQSPSQKREQMRELLSEWHNGLLNDEHFLEQKRSFAPLHRPKKNKKSTLSLAGYKVESLQEFVERCEESGQAWQDGIKHLRMGELEYWVEPLTEDRLLVQAVSYASDSSEDDFQVFNALLYRFLPERPFRFYWENQWQSAASCPSVTTLEQLATFCDKHWELAKYHLYNGALLTWLEYGKACRNLQEWYRLEIAEYSSWEIEYQSLGLELVLEHVLPSLIKPELLITLNGHAQKYFLPAWDRELAHQPLTLTVTNSTRGAAILSIKLLKDTDGPDWLKIQPLPGNSSQHLGPPYLRPGELHTFTCLLSLNHIHLLEHHQTCQYRLCIEQHTSSQQEGRIYEYPVRLQTMAYHQGLRWRLWRLGLRGGWPGLWINFVAAALLALLLLLLAPLLLRWQPFLSLLEIAAIAGLKGMISSFPDWKFLLIAGFIGGVSGTSVGWRKGHSDYPLANNRKMFIQISFGLSLFLFFLFYAIWKYTLPDAPDPSVVWLGTAQGLGSLVISLLLVLIAYLLSGIRSLLELFLRRYYAELLHPKGSV